MSIANRLREVTDSLPQGVRLVAVSKFHPAEYVKEAYDAGQRVFGESREQELSRKVEVLPKDIEWHFIGHLQTNKVKYIAPYISMIDAVDSLKLLREINKQAAAHGRTIKVLLELHIAVSYGLNISTAARSISHRVKDEVEQATGLKVARVIVSVDDVIA